MGNGGRNGTAMGNGKQMGRNGMARQLRSNKVSFFFFYLKKKNINTYRLSFRNGMALGR
jgi:hypothetical protein